MIMNHSDGAVKLPIIKTGKIINQILEFSTADLVNILPITVERFP